VKLSTRNQIRAKVVRINAGDAIANVEMDANGQRLVASITVEAVRELGIAEGDDVIALVKASDVMVAVED
jgi:molybdopterin-binding protein